MKTWIECLRDGLWPGTLAGLLSGAVLGAVGHLELRRPLAPLNAPSHWLWGDHALRQEGRSWRYTALGLLIHQGSALMWGVLYERLAGRARPSAGSDLRDAAAATAVAATVDLALTPRRFTPGFERRLSAEGLVLVYAGFAVGLALGRRLAGRRLRTH